MAISRLKQKLLAKLRRNSGHDVTLSARELDLLVEELETIESNVTAGSGDFSGPASSVDANIVTFDGTSGKTGQDSGVAVSLISTNTSNISTNSTNIGTLQTDVGNLQANAQIQVAQLDLDDTAVANISTYGTAITVGDGEYAMILGVQSLFTGGTPTVNGTSVDLIDNVSGAVLYTANATAFVADSGLIWKHGSSNLTVTISGEVDLTIDVDYTDEAGSSARIFIYYILNTFG